MCVENAQSRNFKEGTPNDITGNDFDHVWLELAHEFKAVLVIDAGNMVESKAIDAGIFLKNEGFRAIAA
jgi:hypothetical protein